MKFCKTFKRVQKFRNIIAKHRLHRRCGTMMGWTDLTVVGICYKKNVPIGACLLTRSGKVGVFIRRKYRRRGYGRKLLNYCLIGQPKPTQIWNGSKAARKLYSHL